MNLVGAAADMEKGRAEIMSLHPDLVLADIKLKDGNSFSLLEQIPLDFQLVFITAYNQFAIQALNLGAFAYLLKPLDEKEFNNTMMKCFHKQVQYNFEKQQLELVKNFFNSNQSAVKKIALKGVEFTQIIDVDDIVYCQSDKGYTTFFMNDNSKIVVSKVLKEYESILPDDTFIRCHQSYLFNINCLKKYYRDGQIELTNGTIIPVSDRRRNNILNLIDKLSEQ